MKYKLDIYDRALLLNILPENSDLLMIGIYQDFLRSISFTEEEFDKYQIDYDNDNGIKWLGNCEMQVEIGNKVLSKIVSILKSCKENDLLGDDQIDLYNKFIREE